MEERAPVQARLQEALRLSCQPLQRVHVPQPLAFSFILRGVVRCRARRHFCSGGTEASVRSLAGLKWSFRGKLTLRQCERYWLSGLLLGPRARFWLVSLNVIEL